MLNRLGNTCPRPSILSIPKVKISRGTVKAERRWSTSITNRAFKLLFNSIFTYPQVISLKNSAGNFKQYHFSYLHFPWALLQQTWYHSSNLSSVDTHHNLQLCCHALGNKWLHNESAGEGSKSLDPWKGTWHFPLPCLGAGTERCWESFTKVQFRQQGSADTSFSKKHKAQNHLLPSELGC